MYSKEEETGLITSETRLVHINRQAQPVFVLPKSRSRQDENTGYLLIKRLFDIIFASLFSVLVLSWLIPLMAVLIKLNSKGPVFFIQKRTGKDGRVFKCIKFRTMKINDSADVKQALQDDARVTLLGNFLRNTNLDELPQFLNVLIGEMSVIGPRPHMIYHTVEFSGKLTNYARRHEAKPGITGLAQIKGWRGATPTFRSVYKRVQWDIYYINHQSIKLDAYIFMQTLREVILNFIASGFKVIQGKY